MHAPKGKPFKNSRHLSLPQLNSNGFLRLVTRFLNNETTVRMVLMACLLGDFAKDEITFRAWKLITKTLSKEYARNASRKLHPAISAR